MEIAVISQNTFPLKSTRQCAPSLKTTDAVEPEDWPMSARLIITEIDMIIMIVTCGVTGQFEPYGTLNQMAYMKGLKDYLLPGDRS